MNGTERKIFREFDYGRVKIYLIIPSIYSTALHMCQMRKGG